jgi:hypothetical protein
LGPVAVLSVLRSGNGIAGIAEATLYVADGLAAGPGAERQPVGLQRSRSA